MPAVAEQVDAYIDEKQKSVQIVLNEKISDIEELKMNSCLAVIF